MPTCRRKRVVLTQPSESLLRALKSNPSRDVFYLQQTGEIFETYEYVLVPLCTRSSSSLFCPQSLCCANVLLSLEAIPVRSHRQKWSRLLSGFVKRTFRGRDTSFAFLGASQACYSQGCSIPYVVPYVVLGSAIDFSVSTLQR